MPKKLAKKEFTLLKEQGYSVKALQLYINRVNVGSMGRPDVVFVYTGPCGDTMKIYLKLGENGVIQDAKFQYDGCLGLACSGSALTTLIIGKTVEEARKITAEDLLKELGGLPEIKRHCAKLAVTTLRKALEKLRDCKIVVDLKEYL